MREKTTTKIMAMLAVCCMALLLPRTKTFSQCPIQLYWLEFCSQLPDSASMTCEIEIDSVVYRSRWFPLWCVQLTTENKEKLERCPSIKRLIPHTNLKPCHIPSKVNGNGRSSSKPISFTLKPARNITIAVFDAGFQGLSKLPVAESSLPINYNFILNNDSVRCCSDHGTMALSMILCDTNLLLGSTKKLYICLGVTENTGHERIIEEHSWLRAMEWAEAAGAKIISSSLNYTYFDNAAENHTWEHLDGRQSVISLAAAEAARRGMLVVTSAGNEGSTGWQKIAPPCDADSIICVGSIDKQGKVSSFSSRGPSADGRVKPDVVAPGESVWVINRYGHRVIDSGTSFAAPLVARIAAELWLACPAATAMDVREAILSTASRREMPDSLYGYGVPDARLALESLTQLCDALEFRFSFQGDGCRIELQSPLRTEYRLSFINDCGEAAEITSYVPDGRTKLASVARLPQDLKGLLIESEYGVHFVEIK